MYALMGGLINGTTREHYIMLFGMAGSFALIVGFVGAWIGARIGARRALRDVQRAAFGEGAAHLTRIEQSIDAIALEVERISEAQRFAARIAAEPRPSSAPAPQHSSRAVTPH